MKGTCQIVVLFLVHQDQQFGVLAQDKQITNSGRVIAVDRKIAQEPDRKARQGAVPDKVEIVLMKRTIQQNPSDFGLSDPFGMS